MNTLRAFTKSLIIPASPLKDIPDGGMIVIGIVLSLSLASSFDSSSSMDQGEVKIINNKY